MKTMKLLLTLSLLLALSECTSFTKRKLSSSSMKSMTTDWDYNYDCNLWYYNYDESDSTSDIIIEETNADASGNYPAWMCSPSSGNQLYNIDGSIYGGGYTLVPVSEIPI